MQHLGYCTSQASYSIYRYLVHFGYLYLQFLLTTLSLYSKNIGTFIHLKLLISKIKTNTCFAMRTEL